LGSRESWTAVHVPRCQRVHASLGLGRRSPISATVSTYGHALRAADPRTRVGLSPRCSPGTNRCQVASASPVRCHTGGLRAAIRSRRLSLRRAPLARTRRITGRGARAKAWFARSFDDVARALLVTPRAPGSPVRFAPWSGKSRGSSLRPRSPSDASPRRATPSKGSGCLLSRRNPYASGGLLPRARPDRGPVTPPLSRHCSGTRAPF
jgi:hypothetical protein